MSAGGGTAVSETPEYIRDVHEGMVRGTIPESSDVFGDSHNLLYYVRNKTINESNFSTLFTHSPGDVVHDLTTDRGRFRTNLYTRDAKVDWDDLVTQAKSTIVNTIRDEVFSNLEEDFNSILSDALTKVSSITSDRFDRVPSLANSAINSVTQNSQQTMREIINNFANEVYDNLHDFGLEATTTSISFVNQLITTAISAADTMVNQALTKALELASNSIVEDAVDAYEAETEIDYLRGVGRFAGEASIAGVANTSGFGIGKAILEDGREKAVNKYRADLKLKVVDLIMNIHPNVATSVASLGAQNFKDQMSMKLETYRLDLSEKFRLFSIQLSESFKLLEMVSQTDSNNYEALLRSYYSSYNVKLQGQEAKESYFLLDAVKGLMTLYEKEMSEDPQRLFDMDKTLGAFELTAYNEYYDKKHEYTRAYNQDEFEKMARAGNMIAAFSGGTSTIMDKPSKNQTALGGAAAGASIGAHAGGVPGAVVGGVVGGLAGLIGG